MFLKHRVHKRRNLSGTLIRSIMHDETENLVKQRFAKINIFIAFPRLIVTKLAEQVRNGAGIEISNSISVRAVSRRLNEVNLMGRIACKKPRISERRGRLRLIFDKLNYHRASTDLRSTVFINGRKLNRMVLALYLGKIYTRYKPNRLQGFQLEWL